MISQKDLRSITKFVKLWKEFAIAVGYLYFKVFTKNIHRE